MLLDYYRILGVFSTATQSEIRESYINLSKKYHPDKSDDTVDPEIYKQIQEAYSILSDEEKRKKYDNLIEAETIIPDETIKRQELVESNGIFTYRCRCGDKYELDEEDLVEWPVYVQCESCSLYLCINC